MKKYLLLFLCITLWLGVLVGLRGFAATEASVPAGSVRVRTENGILELELEEYVAALLSAAMPDNYPEEALRAHGHSAHPDLPHAGIRRPARGWLLLRGMRVLLFLYNNRDGSVA